MIKCERHIHYTSKNAYSIQNTSSTIGQTPRNSILRKDIPSKQMSTKRSFGG